MLACVYIDMCMCACMYACMYLYVYIKMDISQDLILFLSWKQTFSAKFLVVLVILACCSINRRIDLLKASPEQQPSLHKFDSFKKIQ